MSLGSTIKKFDVYKKVNNDVTQGTNVGGIVSIITVITLLTLVFKETSDFLYPSMRTELRPDDPVTREEMLITIDIEFPRYPCEIMSLDIQDIMMSHHPNIASVAKRRIDKDGKFMEDTPYQILNEHNLAKQYEIAKQAFVKEQGCRLIGSFTVKEVPGNFHVSSHAYQGLYTRLIVENVTKRVDTGHFIHDLFFGSRSSLEYVEGKFPEAQLRRLQGTRKTKALPQNQRGSYVSHYHIDVVPTIYQNTLFKNTKTFQYTSSHNYAQVPHMPMAIFRYSIGGMVVDIYPNRMSFLQFIIKLCAIIGGAYMIASLFDSFLNKVIKPKNEYQMIN